MQYLKMTSDMTLSKLSSIVGERNVDTVLNANSVFERSVNIGRYFDNRNKQIIQEYGNNGVDYQTKMSILNQFVSDSDIYEKAALGSDEDWVTLSQYNCFMDAIKIPEDIKLPSAEGVYGNGEPISDRVYQDCNTSLKELHYINPAIFAEYNASFSGSSYGITTTGPTSSNSLLQWFKIPDGEVCLYSSISQELLKFPVYPDGFDDGVRANYDEMSETLYQYEPWNVYKSSGPREITFVFKFHRDIWGDHRDGNANNLIRGCKANCFPDYNGALVNAPLVTLYIHGENFITGIMTDCKVSWDKPIGLDGFYLKCDLSLTIREVSQEKLNYTTVRNKRLIS